MKRTRNGIKKRSPHNLILEEVIGLTTKNGNGLASSISSSKCAYIAGCVVVLYDVHSGTQSHLMAPHRVPTPLSCVTLSADSKIVAAGETAFNSAHHPGILLWDCATLTFICELKGHQYGVVCMALSPDGKHLVSAGVPRDGYICLWDWRRKILAAKVKMSSVSCPVASVDFSLDKKFIITAAKNELKFWKVRWSTGSRASTQSASLTMMKKVDLCPHKDSPFVAVTSLRWQSNIRVNHIQAGEEIPFYAVTERGTLCKVYPGSSLVNSVELKVEKCFALSISTDLVACACNNGLVKLFATNSLEYAGGLCYTETKRSEVSIFMDCEKDVGQVEPGNQPAFPDAIACQFSTSEKIVVIYGNRSLYIWNIHDIHKATRCCVLVAHSGCIWGISNVPCENMHDPSLSCVTKGCPGGLSFATCSADGNIRLWDLELQPALLKNGTSLPDGDSCDGPTCLASAGTFERDSVAKRISSPGFRSMAVSSDGKYLATGDCQGNIHIFNLCTSEYICLQDAHGAEILSLGFNLANRKDDACTKVLESRLLASGARDGRIHLFDVDRNFTLLGSIDYHSSAVTAIKVSQSGHDILSCGADGSLVLHNVDASDKECKISFQYKIATNGTLYDMAVDHQLDVAFTVGKDRKINAFDIKSGKLTKWVKHDGDVGNPIKVTTDGSCGYLACSYSNRCIYLYDNLTGELVAQATGHGDVITGIIFLPDCKHLVSVGADTCIFVWKLPSLLSSKILQRTKKFPVQFLPESLNQPMISNKIKSHLVADHQHNSCSNEESINGVTKKKKEESINGSQICDEMFLEEGNRPENAGFRFSISQLPKWAQCEITKSSLSVDTDSILCKVALQQDQTFIQSESASKDIVEDGQQSETLSRCRSETDSSEGSPSPLETCSWASTNHWSTIHTVCMDLLDSPQTCELKGLNMPGPATVSTSQDQDMETDHCSKRVKLSSKDLSISNHTDEDVDASRKDSQDYEIFDSKFCTEPKADRGESSTRQSYVSRFLVKKELLEGRRGSSCMHGLNSFGASPRKPLISNSNFIPTKLESLLKVTGNQTPSSVTVISDVPKVPDNITGSEMPSKIEIKNVRDEEAPDKKGEVEIVRSCEEALLNLEAAVENALQSFSKLATDNNGEEKLSGFEVQLCTKAAARLPSIERKIQEITKLLQSANNFQPQN